MTKKNKAKVRFNICEGENILHSLDSDMVTNDFMTIFNELIDEGRDVFMVEIKVKVLF